MNFHKIMFLIAACLGVATVTKPFGFMHIANKLRKEKQNQDNKKNYLSHFNRFRNQWRFARLCEQFQVPAEYSNSREARMLDIVLSTITHNDKDQKRKEQLNTDMKLLLNDVDRVKKRYNITEMKDTPNLTALNRLFPNS